MTDTDRHSAEINRAQAMGDAFDLKAFQQMMAQYGHTKLLNMLYRDHGDDWVELALPYHVDLVGDVETGVLASGPIISLMDNAASMSVWAKRGAFSPQVTMDLRVDYMRPATPGNSVIARIECYKATRSIAFVRGIAHDGDSDDPIAHAAGTFISMDSFQS